jgi:hypothetical protein
VVSKDRHEVGAHEHAGERAGDHRGLAGRRQRPLLGEHRREDAAEKHLVQVEERSDANDQRERAVPVRQRQRVEPSCQLRRSARIRPAPRDSNKAFRF